MFHMEFTKREKRVHPIRRMSRTSLPRDASVLLLCFLVRFGREGKIGSSFVILHIELGKKKKKKKKNEVVMRTHTDRDNANRASRRQLAKMGVRATWIIDDHTI